MRHSLALVFALAGFPAWAHPHVFVDTGLTLRVDADGRLQSVEVVWVYDTLTSLLALEDLGLDPDGDGALTDAERAVLSALAGDWGEGFDGDLRVRAGGRGPAAFRPRRRTGRPARRARGVPPHADRHRRPGGRGDGESLRSDLLHRL